MSDFLDAMKKLRYLTLRCAPLLASFLAGCFVTYIWIKSDPVYQLTSGYPTQNYISFKKQVASKLSTLYIRLTSSEGLVHERRLFYAQEILHLISSLDFEMFRKLKPETTHNSNDCPVCPEEYSDAYVSWPYQTHAFKVKECETAKPLSTLVSVFFDLVHASVRGLSRLKVVLGGIRALYPDLPITVAYSAEIKDVVKSVQTRFHVSSVRVHKEETAGALLNIITSQVSTPYLLVARNLIQFTNLTQLERLIRVSWNIPEVAVVGGAFRNDSGYWTPGCLRTTLKNYALKVEEGYDSSAEDCMFCSIVQGPFLINTTVAKKIRFDDSLVNHVYEDFFLRLREDGKHAMVCPDVMFFADLPLILENKHTSLWKPVAAKWKISDIIFSNLTILFDCDDLNISCNEKQTSFYLLPRCCIRKFHTIFNRFLEILDSNSILYEIDSGSQLAAVKMNEFMPWDIDGDMEIEEKGYYFILQNLDYFKTQNISLRLIEELPKNNKNIGLFHLLASELIIEIESGIKISSFLLPKEYQHLPTKSKFGNRWVNSQTSPGLYVRNRYGPGVLNHVQSWRYNGQKHAYDNYGSRKFPTCPIPGFHSCLDKFPVDGSFDFILKQS